MWSWAVTVWELWKGERPYDSIEDIDIVKQKIIENQIHLEKPSIPINRNENQAEFWNELYEILKLCWKFNPAERPSVPQILEKLKTFRSSDEGEDISSLPQASHMKNSVCLKL